MILLHDTWAVIATTYKRVYTIGLNDKDQLAIPSIHGSQELVYVDILAGKNIKSFLYNDNFWRVYALIEEREPLGDPTGSSRKERPIRKDRRKDVKARNSSRSMTALGTATRGTIQGFCCLKPISNNWRPT